MTGNINSLKKKAHDLVQKGRYDSALKVFNLILEEDPKDASVHNKVGDILLKLDRPDKAKEHFLTSARLYSDEGLHMVSLSVCRKINRNFPDEIEASLLMGDCFLQQDKPEQAKNEFIKYIKGKPSLDSPDLARVLQSLVTLDPDTPKWLTNLAKVAYRQKNEAFLDFAVSLAMERNHAGLQKIVTMLKKLRAELHPAEKTRSSKKRSSKRSEPDTAELLRSLSFDEADVVPAERDSRRGRSTKSPSRNKPVREDVSVAEENRTLAFDKSDIRRGGMESSEDLLKDITSGDGEDWSSTEEEATGPKRIGEYFVASGLLNANDVLKALEKQSESSSNLRLGDVLVSMNLVSVRQVREALSKQVADMRNRLEKDPTDALGFIEMANLLLDVGDFYGAVGAYLRAAEIYRNEQRDYMVFELLEGVLDICPESLSAAKEIVRIRHSIDKEGQARAFYRLAVAYLLNDSQYEAIASLEAAVEVYPNYKDARDLMMGLRPEELRESGVMGVADVLDDIDGMKTESAKSMLADIILEFKTGVDANISAEDYSTHFDLGIAYREMGLFREAVQEFEKVLPNPEYRLKAREMLGRCTFDMKRYDEAEDHFRKGLVLAKAANDDTSAVGFHINLHRVYEFTGRSGHAEAELEKAKKIDPVLARALQLE